MTKTTDNGHNPPKLGDCEFTRDGDRWQLKRNGALVVRALTMAQMLCVIRGELPIDELIKAYNVSLSVPKKE